MTIKAGDRMPQGTFKRMTKDGPKDLTTDELFKGKLLGAKSPFVCEVTVSGSEIVLDLDQVDGLKVTSQ